MFDISFYGNLLFQVIVLVYFLSIRKIWSFSTAKPPVFSTIITALLFFILFHALSIFGSIGTPIALIYGPLIYFSFYSLIGEKVSFFHLSPYLFFSFAYLVCFGLSPMYSFAENTLYHYYYPVYLLLIPLSLLLYSLQTFRQRLKEKSRNITHNDYILLDTLIFLAFSVSIPLFIVGLDPYFHLQWDMQPYYLIYMLLALAACYLIFHLIKFPRKNNIDLFSKTRPKIDAEDLSLADEIRSLIFIRQLYLDPDIDLKKLAAVTEIPAWQVSKILNQVIGKNFYELMAEYRIAHAKKLIHSDVFNKLTLEHIAQQSGFKSKSSFNRYFKSIEKCSPQEYKKRL